MKETPNSRYKALQNQIDFLKAEQRKIEEDSNKKLEERLAAQEKLGKKLATTNDCDFIFDILTKKTEVGTSACSYHEFQTVAANPNINRKIFELIFAEGLKTKHHSLYLLLTNKGIPFEWRVEVLRQF